MTVKEVGDIVIYVAAILTATGAIILFIQKFLIAPMKKVLKEEITDMVKEIHDQVTLNGGGSLKDDVTLMRQDLEDVKSKLEEIPRVWDTVESIKALLNGHLAEHRKGTE